MVTKFGMSDLGPLSLESQSGELGRDWMTRSEYCLSNRSPSPRHCRRLLRPGKAADAREPHGNGSLSRFIEKKPLTAKNSVRLLLYTDVPEKQQYVPTLDPVHRYLMHLGLLKCGDLNFKSAISSRQEVRLFCPPKSVPIMHFHSILYIYFHRGTSQCCKYIRKSPESCNFISRSV